MATATMASATQGNLTDHARGGYFGSSESRSQAQEDTAAWWSVCSILLAVVSAGTLGMALTVLWVAWR